MFSMLKLEPFLEPERAQTTRKDGVLQSDTAGPKLPSPFLLCPACIPAPSALHAVLALDEEERKAAPEASLCASTTLGTAPRRRRAGELAIADEHAGLKLRTQA